jgi:DNA-binding LacI/PurR family transcriptional regulator
MRQCPLMTDLVEKSVSGLVLSPPGRESPYCWYRHLLEWRPDTLLHVIHSAVTQLTRTFGLAVQQAERSIIQPHVAFLGAESPSTNEHFFNAFRQAMMEHGYVDGQNVILEQRRAEGRSERFPELISELIGLKADVIVAVSLPAAFAAKNATSTLPIVFIASDPLGSGLAV